MVSTVSARNTMIRSGARLQENHHRSGKSLLDRNDRIGVEMLMYITILATYWLSNLLVLLF